MKTKFFTKNGKGKIEFTEKELKTLLDEIYNDGYNDGRMSGYTYTTPYRYISPWYATTATTSDISVSTTSDDSTTITIKGEE